MNTASSDSRPEAATVADAIEGLKFDDSGLLPVVVQDDETDRVLMLAWMDAEAVRRTLTEGRVTYWSRSRQEYWRKGDTSGHFQYLRGAEMDCDGDTLLIRIEQVGAACHTGSHSCFDGRELPVTLGDPQSDSGN